MHQEINRCLYAFSIRQTNNIILY